MTVMAHDHDVHAAVHPDVPRDARDEDVDPVAQAFLALGVPEGLRAELIDGKVVVTPPPLGDHENIVALVNRQIVRHAMTDMLFSGNKGLALPGSEGRLDYMIPDGVVAPVDRQVFSGAGSWMEPDGVDLVLEVTSSDPGPDRSAKRRAYARGDIPLYLLVDRDERTVTTFSEPEDDDYARAVTVTFGKPVPLPQPFGFDLDTSRFE